MEIFILGQICTAIENSEIIYDERFSDLNLSLECELADNNTFEIKGKNNFSKALLSTSAIRLTPGMSKFLIGSCKLHGKGGREQKTHINIPLKWNEKTKKIEISYNPYIRID